MQAPLTSYELLVYNGSLVKQGAITSHSGATFISRFCDVGTFTLNLNKSDPLWRNTVIEEGSYIVCQRTRVDENGTKTTTNEFAGPVWGFDEKGLADQVIVSGFDDMLWVSKRITVPDSGQAYDSQSAVQASTAILHYAAQELTAAADSTRDVYGLTLDTDPNLGSNVSANSRYTNLLPLLQYLAVASSPELGVRIIFTAGARLFQVYQPAIASGAQFGIALGNLMDYEYTKSGPTGNAVYVGGSNTGSSRVIRHRTDSASLSAWGMVEGPFLDVRDSGNSAYLDDKGDAQLAATAVTKYLTIKPLDTPALAYGRDYGLGSIVTVNTDREQVQQTIRQVTIQLDSQNQELIIPTLGTPLSGQSYAPWRGKTPDQLAQIAQALNYIEGVQ